MNDIHVFDTIVLVFDYGEIFLRGMTRSQKRKKINSSNLSDPNSQDTWVADKSNLLVAICIIFVKQKVYFIKKKEIHEFE